MVAAATSRGKAKRGAEQRAFASTNAVARLRPVIIKLSELSREQPVPSPFAPRSRRLVLLRPGQ